MNKNNLLSIILLPLLFLAIHVGINYNKKLENRTTEIFEIQEDYNRFDVKIYDIDFRIKRMQAGLNSLNRDIDQKVNLINQLESELNHDSYLMYIKNHGRISYESYDTITKISISRHSRLLQQLYDKKSELSQDIDNLMATRDYRIKELENEKEKFYRSNSYAINSDNPQKNEYYMVVTICALSIVAISYVLFHVCFPFKYIVCLIMAIAGLSYMTRGRRGQ
jgi:hypothetical protein